MELDFRSYIRINKDDYYIFIVNLKEKVEDKNYNKSADSYVPLYPININEKYIDKFYHEIEPECIKINNEFYLYDRSVIWFTVYNLNEANIIFNTEPLLTDNIYIVYVNDLDEDFELFKKIPTFDLIIELNKYEYNIDDIKNLIKDYKTSTENNLLLQFKIYNTKNSIHIIDDILKNLINRVLDFSSILKRIGTENYLDTLKNLKLEIYEHDKDLHIKMRFMYKKKYYDHFIDLLKHMASYKLIKQI